MPSKSEKQKKFMRAACHSKEFADKVGISQSVACEFVQADNATSLEKAAETNPLLKRVLQQLQTQE